MTWQVDTFATATIAICVFFLGGAVVSRVRPLGAYGIPDSMVGGAFCALAAAILYYGASLEIDFDIERRDLFLAYFFAALGLKTDVRKILGFGRPLVLLVLLAAAFIFLQNLVGIAMAAAFDLHPKAGIVAGSMALMGRTGTTIAWAPTFAERFGIDYASRLGIGASMFGLLAACCLGGPVARYLIARHAIVTPGPSAELEVGISRDAVSPQLDYRAFLSALLRVHLAIAIGHGLSLGLAALGLEMPLYILCLIGAIILYNAIAWLAPKAKDPASEQGLSLLADVSLGLFYTMTIMSLQLWASESFLRFLLVVILAQAVIAAAFAGIVVFRVLGRDYEAAVIASGFVGMALGSTATTMAIMTAVAKEYGRARMAFLIVPLACGVFIDIVNSLAIKLLVVL